MANPIDKLQHRLIQETGDRKLYALQRALLNPAVAQDVDALIVAHVEAERIRVLEWAVTAVKMAEGKTAGSDALEYVLTGVKRGEDLIQ